MRYLLPAKKEIFMALQNRSTIAAIVPETTEATPVAPSSASDDYIALQDGFSMEPAFNELENDELTGSIGQAKSILGFEEPTASLSHYLKHSGTEGTEPNFGLLIESLLGAKTVNATEYNTVTGATAGTSSARATIVVDTGEGANFERGQALLIKDGANGYSVRNVLSISGDTLTLGFNLANAPGTGVDLGLAVLYKPADSNHPTFSTWLYRANGGFTEMMAGSRVTNATISATAGELVNVDFSIEGVEYYFDAIELTSNDVSLDFTDDGGAATATLTAKTYKDPHQLASDIATAMNAQTAETIEVTYSDSTGKFTIGSSTSAVLSLNWSTGTNTATTIGDKIGFTIASDDTGATSYEGDSAIDLTAPQSPSYDSTAPLVAKNNTVLLGDFDDNACFEASELTVTIDGTKSDLLSICAQSGKSGSLITERSVSVDLVFRVAQYDVDKFRRFRENENTQFAATFGEKSGSNWAPGKVANIFMPTATITSLSVQDTDGVLEYAMTLSGFVSNGNGEIYINFL